MKASEKTKAKSKILVIFQSLKNNSINLIDKAKSSFLNSKIIKYYQPQFIKLNYKLFLPASFFLIIYLLGKDLIPETKIFKIISKLNYQDSIVKTIVTILTLIPVIKSIKKFWSGQFPKLNSFLILSVLSLSYVYITRFDQKFEYEILYFSIFYTDLLMIVFVLYFLEFESFNFPKNDFNIEGLRLDNLTKNNQYTEVDTYYRKEYLSRVLNLIKNTSNSINSIGIGIFSEWGSGKSDFILRLSEETKNDKEFILIKFNPWQYSGVDSLYTNYFELLSEKLRPLNKNVSKQILNYSKRIFGESENVWIRSLDSILNIIRPFPNHEDEKNQINRVIENSGRKVLVIIDDSDRLTANELLQLFKLMRNASNFSNTFFIVTMDYEYCVNILEQSGEIHNVKEYLKKIFNVVIKLPVIIDHSLYKEFKDWFKKDFEKYVDLLSASIEMITIYRMDALNITFRKGIFFKVIKNGRDLLLFYNSFKIQLLCTGNEVFLGDLFLLELLKLADFKCYNLLASGEYLTRDPKKGNWITITSSPKEKTENKSTPFEQLNTVAKDIINKLTSSHARNHLGKFKDPINFNLYFSYTLPKDLISRKEFYEILEQEDDIFIERIGLWSKSHKVDLTSVLNNYDFNIKTEHFRKFIKVYLKLRHSKIIFDETIRKSCLNSDRTNFEHFESKYEVVISTVKNFKCSFENKIELTYMYMNFFREKVSNSQRKKEIFEKIRNLELLMQKIYIDATESITEKESLFFKNTIHKVNLGPDENSRDKLNPTVIESYKQLILRNDFQFGLYLKEFFQLGTSDDKGKEIFAHDFFLKKLFPDLSVFHKRLSNFMSTDPQIRSLVEIINGIKFDTLKTQLVDLKGKDYEFVYNMYKNKKNSENDIITEYEFDNLELLESLKTLN